MKEIARVENKELVIEEEIINSIKVIEKQINELKKLQDEYKKSLLEVMEKNNIYSFEDNKKELKITIVPATASVVFDTKKFQEENPDMYRLYLKEQNRKSSVRLTIRK